MCIHIYSYYELLHGQESLIKKSNENLYNVIIYANTLMCRTEMSLELFQGGVAM